MNNALYHRILEVIDAIPNDARITEYEGFRDDDLGDATVGVLLTFSTGQSFQISVPADRHVNANKMAWCTAAVIAGVKEIRAAIADELNR